MTGNRSSSHTGSATRIVLLVTAAAAVLLLLLPLFSPSAPSTRNAPTVRKRAPQKPPLPPPTPQPTAEEKRKKLFSQHADPAGNTHIACLHDAGQTYEFYAPPGAPLQQTPILYAFHPGGNGRAMIQQFAPAASRLGWVIAASNNSRNGPWKDIFKAQDAVLRDTEARLDLHPARRFAAGFSGGARSSLALAFRYPGKISGVLAMGAGWPVNTNLKPGPNPLDVSILIGNADSNINYDIPRTEKKLRAARVNQITTVYPGGHVQPPQQMIEASCDWLNNCALGRPAPHR